jgi:hypothetical protein
MALDYMECATVEVFGITLRFQGGLISDHTETCFYSAFPILSENSLSVGKEREMKPTKNSYLVKKLQPDSTTLCNVYMLCECRLDEMFGTMKRLVL